MSVEAWTNTAEISDMKVAGLCKCRYLVDVRCVSKTKPRFLAEDEAVIVVSGVRAM